MATKSTFDGNTKLSKVFATVPGALEYIISLNPHDFTRLQNPVMRKYMSPRITLKRVAAMANIAPTKLVAQLNQLAGNEVAESPSLSKEIQENSPLPKEIQGDSPAKNPSLPKVIQGDSPTKSPPLPKGDLGGFSVPQTPTQPPDWLTDEVKPRIIDVRAIDDAAGDPMPPIMIGLRRLAPGQVALLKHRWEPQPLYDIWQKTGLEWFSQKVKPLEWHIYIHRPPQVKPWKRENRVLILLDHLSPPEIGPRCAAMFDQLEEGEMLEIRSCSKVLLQQAKEGIEERHKSTFRCVELEADNGRWGLEVEKTCC